MEPIMRLLLPFSSTSIMRSFTFVPLNGVRSSVLRSVASDAGTNTLTLLTRTTRPPFTTCITLPVTISPLSLSSAIRSRPFSASSLAFERRTVPSASFTFTTTASTSSPTATGLSSCSNSSAGINPECLAQRSTWTSVPLTAVTVPVTFWPFFIGLSEASTRLAKSSPSSVSTFSSFSFTMLIMTSSIALRCVDAPADNPIFLYLPK